jgi:hypothetical protein
MKTTYEAPQISVSEYRVRDNFLLSGTTTATTSIQYDSIEGWSPIKPPKH